jgi:hypothetical protein
MQTSGRGDVSIPYRVARCYTFKYQKCKVWYILEGLRIENVGIYCGHLVYLNSLGIVYGHLVKFVVIWQFLRFGMLYQKIWQLGFRSVAEALKLPFSFDIFDIRTYYLHM